MKQLLVCFCLLLGLTSGGEVVGQGYQQKWGPVASTGPLGTARNYQIYGVVPSTYTIDWFNDGTAAVACTFQVEGSSDGLHWSAISGVTDCTGAVGMFHITNKPVMFIRYNLLTYTSGGASTAVTLNYTRGQ